MISLESLLSGIVTLPQEMAQLTVTSVTQDSREVKPGSLFIARAGLRSHGLDYLDTVVSQGAIAIVVEIDERWDAERIEDAASQSMTASAIPVLALEDLTQAAGVIAARFYDDPSAKLDLVGITGTNGKTSCAWMLAHALNLQSHACMIGTIGNGTPGELSTATHTTPDAVTLQGLLAEMHVSRCVSVAMEVSSHAMTQGRVAGAVFDIAVFANLSRDHLDYHGSMEAYGDAKAQLFRMSGLKAAVINFDDDYAETISSCLDDDVKLVPVSSRGEKHAFESGLVAEKIETTATGLAFDLRYMGDVESMHTGLFGRFNVDNLLLSAGVLISLGHSLKQAILLLSQVPPVPGRMQLLTKQGAATVVVDYAHTPDALEKALSACREHAQGELWCLFGCGGDRDQGKRAEMGRIADTLADRLIITSDNPRSEEPQLIADQILEGVADQAKTQIELDRAQAITLALQKAAADDLVLIAGKGHEEYQIIGDQRIHFSDVEVARRCFREMSA
ncbi:UDP-N-acetylmuramoyl-L-alanyl-D-glutamate--2,6-diaminopimelate ligase [Solemya elarraichensis gill symbiont]|uniref:UDP-N-acetylmuramoyl-L-alanyl-D-glutamate--2,6-diaminopimelate ligase n=2 Tax=Solemya elarraichensis gill symbiont TaxID=1918949 RepID=A0A1T2LDA3_9GAMM|nr:UDP-N-acetylmuramoyl-L-alanyl-D-glutamate--2,6-diaminopimelate ligase [Solemya elarraichensis gill symbiont]